MFCGLSYQPYDDMTVEYHILKFEILLVLILVDECCLEFALLSYIELLHFDLLGEINPVLRHSLEDGFLCTPVDGELLVLLVVVEVFDLVF